MKYPKGAKKKVGASAGAAMQYAALPWRFEEDLEILLLTSRDTRRWVIPKGWPMKGRKPHAAAALEAQQEAGLLGKIEKKTLGSYHYRKRFKNGAALWCKVDVFPMRVMRQLKSWREKTQRVTQWFPYAVAAEQIAEEDLKELILAYGEALSEIFRAAPVRKN
jgi:8-oxo-dGTP pyrophosphatase MutT (NUDIX family)